MSKIFISHSSKNSDIVKFFIEFLQLGMGVKRDDIFCTSLLDNITSGEPYIERIRNELHDCEIVISIITKQYLESSFCLIEAGAAWAMSKKFFPLSLVSLKELDGTPLKTLQIRKLNDLETLSVVYDELGDCGVRKRRQTAEFTSKVNHFIEMINEIYYHGNDIEKCLNQDGILLKNDEDGYYYTEIISIRKEDFRYHCYGMKGQIDNPLDNDKANSDWIFYQGDKFPKLNVGDRIKFKVRSTEVRSFPDIGNARNIYVSEIIVI